MGIVKKIQQYIFWTVFGFSTVFTIMFLFLSCIIAWLLFIYKMTELGQIETAADLVSAQRFYIINMIIFIIMAAYLFIKKLGREKNENKLRN